MKSIVRTCASVVALLVLDGCVYGPDYYQRPSVIHEDGPAVYYDGDGYGYGYRYEPGYYSNYDCCFGAPWPGLSFYGSYYYGGNHHRGNSRHDRYRPGPAYSGRGGYHADRGPHGSSHPDRVRTSPASNPVRTHERIDRQ